MEERFLSGSVLVRFSLSEALERTSLNSISRLANDTGLRKQFHIYQYVGEK